MRDKFAFGQQPVLRKRRSKFDLSFNNKTSMSVGKLYPVYVQEIYPGDTFKCDTKIVSRVTSSFLKPVMDNLFMDVFYFFVPNRLVFDKWSQVMGENTESAWAQQTSVDVPTLEGTRVSPDVFVSPGSVGDYLGLPVNTALASNFISVLPFRAFALIWDEWFRDQNLQDPMFINKGSDTSSEVLNTSVWDPSNYTGQLPPVAKTHDYFTSCLPSPQKGNAVDLFNLNVGQIPVRTSSTDVPSPGTEPLSFLNAVGSISSGYHSLGVLGGATGGLGTLSGDGSSTSLPSSIMSLVPTNLFADTSVLGSFNVNDLRNVIALQRMLEKDAEGGTRYTEYLLSHFGVSSPDNRLNRSELLGGTRLPLSIQQVAQTSQASEDSPLANLAAYSLSNGHARYTKGFTEHGFVIGVACIKYFHTYQQGIERFFMRSKRTDFYDPVFANIGNQPVYVSEIYSNVSNSRSVFGYNEAWADLRYRPNKVTGQMRSGVPSSQAVWHFADNYVNPPTLNSQFIEETPKYVDRTLSVPSTSEDQFIVDIYHKQTAYRVLPTYSTPSHLGVN